MFAFNLQVLQPATPIDGRHFQHVSAQGIRRQAGVSAVAVGKAVNLHQPVVETQSQFSGWIHALIEPDASVVQQFAKLRCNLVRRNANIPLCNAECSRPLPDRAEQLAVKLTNKLLNFQKM